jgi:hypothetical protein
MEYNDHRAPPGKQDSFEWKFQGIVKNTVRLYL